MENLKITLIQTTLHWETPDANLNMFADKLNSVREQTDLIVLPEMFSTGFSMNPSKLAERMDGATVQWMKEQAKKANAVVAGSVIIEEGGNYYNRLIWMRPDGSFETYDKRHLFRMAGEDHFYAAGDKRLIVELKGWRICPLVCYDLRFPVWSRNKFLKQENKLDYDLLIYVANWPERRSYPWKNLLVARAIENLSYVIGLNRVGTDGNEINHSGDSVVLNYKGEPMVSIEPQKEFIKTITITYKDLLEFRQNFPAWMDAD